MSRCLRTPLPKLLDVVERKVVASQVQHGVEQHTGVTVGENEAIAPGPMRVARIVTQISVPQCKGQWSQRHRSAGMTAVCFLHRVHGERSDGIDAEFYKLPLRHTVLQSTLTSDCGCWLTLFLRGRVHLATQSIAPFSSS